MARKSQFGKYILSAGEVGSYTVCAEAWRLKAIDRKKRISVATSDAGIKLHNSWARGHDEVIFLTNGVRIVVFIVLLLLLWFHLA